MVQLMVQQRVQLVRQLNRVRRFLQAWLMAVAFSRFTTWRAQRNLRLVDGRRLARVPVGVSALALSLLLSLLPGAVSAAPASDWLTLQPQPQPVYLEIPAQVEAVAQSTVSAQTSGRIIELPFDVNDLAPQGAVIVRFTDTEQKARLQQAEAALKEAQVRFHELDKELTRVQGIFDKGLVAKAALDLAQANFNAAKARQAQASASVKEASEQLEQTVVRAPYSGILQQRLVELGELATPGKPLLVGLSLEHLRLSAQVPQLQVAAVRQSPQARLQTADGTVLELGKPDLTLAPQASRQSHSFLLRVRLPVADYSVQQLYPGSWVRLQLQTGSAPRLLLPSSAVLWRGEVAMVWQKTAAGILLQPVRVRQHGSQLELLAGLAAGSEVATDALAQLSLQQSGQQAGQHSSGAAQEE